MEARRKKTIEAKVKAMQREIYSRRRELWKSTPDPIALLDPAKAFALLGVQFEEPEEICFSIEDTYIGVPASRYAGYVDRKNRKVAISQRFKPESRRFTAAHELGHWILHEDGIYFRIHYRDRPLAGGERVEKGRPEIEIEADYFAACYLMPEKILLQRFREHFGFDTFKGLELNEDLAFRLSFGAPAEATATELVQNGIRFRSILAASCLPMRKASHACSLAKLFRVSSLAIAIRLEELGLVV